MSKEKLHLKEHLQNCFLELKEYNKEIYNNKYMGLVQYEFIK